MGGSSDYAQQNNLVTMKDLRLGKLEKRVKELEEQLEYANREIARLQTKINY